MWAAARFQVLPLLGSHGLLPACTIVDRARWGLLDLGCSDAALRALCDAGLAAGVVALLGVRQAFWVLWVLQLSLMHVGQVFWGYGWELLLAEASFLAGFRPSRVTAWAWRWLTFRLAFGAGLIKLRGDACWRTLTCLDHHFETQPLPNPLSAWFHTLPHGVLAGGVAFNHLVELVLPWLLYTRFRAWAVGGWIGFQCVLILSGNLSFLNWLSIACALATLPDPRDEVPKPHWALALLLATFSILPTLNLLSPNQVMNASFDPLELVNTYGAFGSVDETRHELVIEGSLDGEDWRAYELPCKPGDVDRRPCVAAPWQWRLDWQLWFAWRDRVDDNPWLVHLVGQLLRGDRAVEPLFAVDPFPRDPPRFVRIQEYTYRFDRAHVWAREPVGTYLRPVDLADPKLCAYLDAHGWEH